MNWRSGGPGRLPWKHRSHFQGNSLVVTGGTWLGPFVALAVLELKQVSKFYGDYPAVQDLSFSVPAGCLFGFLGPNGAGKTTSLRMILDILRPTSGSITILGADSAARVRDRLGYLPEEKGLYKKMKAWAVIAYFATLKGVPTAAAKKRAHALLERHGLGQFAEARTEALSKGMAQKVQVLASIAHDPELVILDEPFSGLDPVNQGVLEELVLDLKARGRTVIFSTHVMQHAERLCDHLLVMARGRKCFEGSVDDARRLLAPRVQLRARGDLAPLRTLPGIDALSELTPGEWEVRLRPGTDPQSVLAGCFTLGLPLTSFEATRPSLHDVFVHLVGAEAREAGR